MKIEAQGTLVMAILVLYLGKYLNKKIPFLRSYNIPEPVTGGFLASLVVALLYFVFDTQIDFTLIARDTLLITFFTTIGLSAKFHTLLKGGKALAVLVIVAIAYLIIQNIVGLSAISFSELPRALGIMCGSVSFSGGHGTVIAWAPTFVEQFGITNAQEIGLACSTFGLVIGGVLGGPIAKFLIHRHKLEPPKFKKEEIVIGKSHGVQVNVNYDNMLKAILAISLSVGLGLIINEILTGMGVMLPDFVTALFGGIIVTNIGPPILDKLYHRKAHEIDNPSIALISDVSLGLFLAMSLMTLQLWTIIDLASTLNIILFAQLIVISLFAVFIVFRAMGSDYDAAVIAGGYVGLGLGATPTAIANMTAITKRYGGSPKAFLIVPLVGAFFIDIMNSVVIQFFLDKI